MSLEDGVEYIKIYEDRDVQHGIDGWQLDDMTWYGDGVAVFQYERSIPGVGLELAIVLRNQATLPNHAGWTLKSSGVLSLLEKDWIRWERGIDLNPEELEWD